MVLRDGPVVLSTGEETAVAANEALLVAADAVHATEVEHLRRRQVLRARELPVKTQIPRLAMTEMLLEQGRELVLAIGAARILYVRVAAETVAMLLIPDGRTAVINLIVEDLETVQPVVDPGHAVKTRMGTLVIVVKADFRFDRFCRLHRCRQEQVVGIRMASYLQRFQRAIRDVDAVRAVREPGLATLMVNRHHIRASKGFRPL